ncbi:hypothetical protein HK100_002200 [Physocladia obscura]|uniref:Uncharacterized protein n=1 Tax=Physocladia obscura TaxID=109957 RepID=A0AAD5XJJ7_9FUNG|nr:hypothetical protein HK100_002200 [Physocladia obscura]
MDQIDSTYTVSQSVSKSSIELASAISSDSAGLVIAWPGSLERVSSDSAGLFYESASASDATTNAKLPYNNDRLRRLSGPANSPPYATSLLKAPQSQQQQQQQQQHTPTPTPLFRPYYSVVDPSTRPLLAANTPSNTEKQLEFAEYRNAFEQRRRSSFHINTITTTTAIAANQLSSLSPSLYNPLSKSMKKNKQYRRHSASAAMIEKQQRRFSFGSSSINNKDMFMRRRLQAAPAIQLDMLVSKFKAIFMGNPNSSSSGSSNRSNVYAESPVETASDPGVRAALDDDDDDDDEEDDDTDDTPSVAVLRGSAVKFITAPTITDIVSPTTTNIATAVNTSAAQNPKISTATATTTVPLATIQRFKVHQQQQLLSSKPSMRVMPKRPIRTTEIAMINGGIGITGSSGFSDSYSGGIGSGSIGSGTGGVSLLSSSSSSASSYLPSLSGKSAASLSMLNRNSSVSSRPSWRTIATISEMESSTSGSGNGSGGSGKNSAGPLSFHLAALPEEKEQHFAVKMERSRHAAKNLKVDFML